MTWQIAVNTLVLACTNFSAKQIIICANSCGLELVYFSWITWCSIFKLPYISYFNFHNVWWQFLKNIKYSKHFILMPSQIWWSEKKLKISWFIVAGGSYFTSYVMTVLVYYFPLYIYLLSDASHSIENINFCRHNKTFYERNFTFCYSFLLIKWYIISLQNKPDI